MERGFRRMGENTLPEQIAHQLRREILLGNLKPGAPIKERDNAAELGVSRTPMREAIRILAKEGLVELRPARSPVVASPTLKEVTDCITVIVALEELSGELAVQNATEAEIAEIRKLHERMRDNYDVYDHIERFEVDMEFHMAIARASHNEALAETHASYLRRMWRARFLSARTRRNRERVVRQHGDIVFGLQSRDAGQVAMAIHSHLGHLLDSISEAFAGQPETARPAEEQDASKAVTA